MLLIPIAIMTPIITVQKAVWLSALHMFLYVGVLYVRDASRPSPVKGKDVPSVIKARMAGVTVAVALAVILNQFVIEKALQAGQRTEIQVWDDILERRGEWQLNLGKTLRALNLTATLFLGPLLKSLWIEGGWRDVGEGVKNALTSLRGWRNYIIVFSSRATR
jgi:hypothetical protein